MPIMRGATMITSTVGRRRDESEANVVAVREVEHRPARNAGATSRP